MATVDRATGNGQRATTHDVFNQPPPLEPYNTFDADTPLREALARENGSWGIDRLRDIGEVAGSVEARESSVAAIVNFCVNAIPKEP